MIKIFVDFDGTITRQDVGDAMFEHFGGIRCADIVKDYYREKISAVECLEQECLACGEVDKVDLDAFVDDQEIDSTFVDFVKFCNSSGLDCTIVSDGMSYYIERILHNNRLADVQFFSNALDLVQIDSTSKVRFKPSFPYTDEDCDRCACCKRNHMLRLSSDDDTIVYIGEGYSDRCPARYADVVFAKGDLLKYCQQENISFFEYQTFADVVARLENILSTKRPNGEIVGLWKRRRAELARREIFMGG